MTNETGAEASFQSYRSARIATKIVTITGITVNFTNHQFITNNKEIIAYLDEAIKAGLSGITRGDVVTSEDLDPMVALRKKFYAEFREAEAKREAELQDFSPAEGSPESSAKKIGMTSSATIVNAVAATKEKVAASIKASK